MDLSSKNGTILNFEFNEVYIIFFKTKNPIFSRNLPTKSSNLTALN